MSFYAKNGTFDFLSVNGDVHFDECNIVGCNVKGTVLLSNNNYIGNVSCEKLLLTVAETIFNVVLLKMMF